MIHDSGLLFLGHPVYEWIRMPFGLKCWCYFGACSTYHFAANSRFHWIVRWWYGHMGVGSKGWSKHL